MAERMRELCAKLGFSELSAEELEQVVARVERGGEVEDGNNGAGAAHSV